MSPYDLDAAIVNLYYIVFVITEEKENFLAMHCSQVRSPHSLHSFKLLLANTAVNQILLALTGGFLQERMLPCDTVLALLPVGPCRYFGPTTCFVAYNIANALNMNIAISVLHSMFFRYRLIRATQMSNARISPHVIPFHFNIVMEVAMREHPDYNLEKYGPFGGFYSTTSPLFMVNSAILFGTAVALPIVIFYWRHHILKALNSSEAVFTEKTRRNSKLLIKALTVQAVMPLLCYVPTGLLYFIAQFSGYKFEFLEYLFPILTTLPCAIDPLVTIYFITPYRVWVRQRIRTHVAPVQMNNNVRSSIVSVTPRSVKVG
ncbi:7TM chemoreceptor [Ancylostoma ceylanicum]|uniref:7TM chemoreceptor n=1 Tax=Ancylostoma ceylanicum TaxID=53326 RepID=A0A0D6LIJ4_9BILA|nr:7TM chemoreceptor [Ancylostoma ceylanicum]